MLIYDFFDGYNYTESESLYARLSFGNMGYSSNYCGMNMLHWNDGAETKVQVKLQCQGSTRIRRVIDMGLVDINQSGEENTLAEFNRCHYDKPVDTVKFPIMRYFDQEKQTKSVMEQCYGLQYCKPQFKIDDDLRSLHNSDQFIFVQVACE